MSNYSVPGVPTDTQEEETQRGRAHGKSSGTFKAC